MNKALPPSPFTRSILMLGLIPAFVALFAPEIIFELIPGLRGYVTLIGSLMSGVGEPAIYSNHPNSASLAFALAYPLVALQSFLAYCNLRKSAFYINGLVEYYRRRKFVHTTISIFAFIAGLSGFFFIGKDSMLCDGCVNQSRMGMAIALLFGCAGCSILVNGVAVLFTTIPRIFLINVDEKLTCQIVIRKIIPTK